MSLAEDILMVFVEEMESRGENKDCVILDVSGWMSERIVNRRGGAISLDELYRGADTCLANEWLKRNFLTGEEKYRHLSITSKGLGVVRSRQRKEEILKNRTLLKKTSDYVEDHKGLSILLGAIISVAVFVLNFVL